MPSSKYLQPSPFEFIRTNLNSRHCICHPAAKESFCIIIVVSVILIPLKVLLSGKHLFSSILLPVSNKDQRSSIKLHVVTQEPSRSLQRGSPGFHSQLSKYQQKYQCGSKFSCTSGSQNTSSALGSSSFNLDVYSGKKKQLSGQL